MKTKRNLFQLCLLAALLAQDRQRCYRILLEQ